MMKIAVLGTGGVGNAIATKLLSLGHQVMMGSRTSNNEKALAFVAKNQGGNASNGTFSEAAIFSEIIFNCTKGTESLNIFSSIPESHIQGKIIIDISNPLDFSKGTPPTLAPCNDNSLGEQLQHALPNAYIVKTLNTIWSGIMVNPSIVNGGDHQLFISGNDSSAKLKATEILISFGWLSENILDLGDISTARGTEMYLALWLRIYGATNNGAFNIKIVR